MLFTCTADLITGWHTAVHHLEPEAAEQARRRWADPVDTVRQARRVADLDEMHAARQRVLDAAAAHPPAPDPALAAVFAHLAAADPHRTCLFGCTAETPAATCPSRANPPAATVPAQ